jgi:Protein of unknown function (DUF1194)
MRLTACLLFLLIQVASSPAISPEIPVDLELVLAVDVSFSMDEEEQSVQREGYQAALVDPAVLEAIAGGAYRRIALAYVEWAGSVEQQVTVDWRLIDGRASAAEVAAELAAKPLRRRQWTSISSALLFSLELFENNGFAGERRVIDVSGDGANNQGMPVEQARDRVTALGLTINGLPLLLQRPVSSTYDLANLDAFYEDCVIGGPGAFMIPVRSTDGFKEAIRTKLVLEIANKLPRGALLQRVAGRERVPCDVGERQLRDWYRNGQR